MDSYGNTLYDSEAVPLSRPCCQFFFKLGINFVLIFFSFIDLLFLFIFGFFNVCICIADLTTIILSISFICFVFLGKDIRTWALTIPIVLVFFVSGGLRILGLSDVMDEFEKEKEKEKKPIDKNVFYIPFANQALLIVLFVITYPLIGKKKE